MKKIKINQKYFVKPKMKYYLIQESFIIFIFRLKYASILRKVNLIFKNWN